MAYSPTRYRIISTFILISLLFVFPAQVIALGELDIPPLDEFVETMMNGEADVLRGVYVPGVLADLVTPQPADNPAYVTPTKDTLTQFGLASKYGSTGLLAHNYLAGKSFSHLEKGQLIFLIYGDGRTETFVVIEFMRVQALTPESITSNFIDLDSGEFLSVSKLFLDAYNRPDHVILQTCLFANGNNSWGRLFIIAEPYDPALSIPTSRGERDDEDIVNLWSGSLAVSSTHFIYQ